MPFVSKARLNQLLDEEYRRKREVTDLEVQLSRAETALLLSEDRERGLEKAIAEAQRRIETLEDGVHERRLAAERDVRLRAVEIAYGYSLRGITPENLTAFVLNGTALPSDAPEPEQPTLDIPDYLETVEAPEGYVRDPITIRVSGDGLPPVGSLLQGRQSGAIYRIAGYDWLGSNARLENFEGTAGHSLPIKELEQYWRLSDAKGMEP